MVKELQQGAPEKRWRYPVKRHKETGNEGSKRELSEILRKIPDIIKTAFDQPEVAELLFTELNLDSKIKTLSEKKGVEATTEELITINEGEVILAREKKEFKKFLQINKRSIVEGAVDLVAKVKWQTPSLGEEPGIHELERHRELDRFIHTLSIQSGHDIEDLKTADDLNERKVFKILQTVYEFQKD